MQTIYPLAFWQSGTAQEVVNWFGRLIRLLVEFFLSELPRLLRENFLYGLIVMTITAAIVFFILLTVETKSKSSTACGIAVLAGLTSLLTYYPETLASSRQYVAIWALFAIIVVTLLAFLATKNEKWKKFLFFASLTTALFGFVIVFDSSKGGYFNRWLSEAVILRLGAFVLSTGALGTSCVMALSSDPISKQGKTALGLLAAVAFYYAIALVSRLLQNNFNCLESSM